MRLQEDHKQSNPELLQGLLDKSLQKTLRCSGFLIIVFSDKKIRFPLPSISQSTHLAVQLNLAVEVRPKGPQLFLRI